MIEFEFHRTLHTANGLRKLDVRGTIPTGQFTALFGPSGAGKTTILRLFAGLIDPERGQISVDNQWWLHTEQRISLPPQKREIGMVFQDYALFPNMTVRDNLRFALRKGQSGSVVDDLIDLMELSQLAHRKPYTLSGGQQQRVALARALVRKPRLLLLDEPLSALDPQMRLRLQEYLQKIHQEFQLSVVLVSHDLPEIFKLADYVWEIEDGFFTRQGTPGELFGGPSLEIGNQRVATLLDIRREPQGVFLKVLCEGEYLLISTSENDAQGLAIGSQLLLDPPQYNWRPLQTKKE
jgi:molybdate transport system ATP-binding protein